MKRTLTYHDGLRLSYCEYGDASGFPILVQHGLIASIDDFDLFDRLIQSKARVICVARPGYGASSPFFMDSFAAWAEIIALLVEELNLAEFDILGMSSGAPYSYSIGHRFPEKVRNIYIFSGMPALYDEIVRSHWPYKWAVNPGMDEMEVLARELFFSNLTAADLERNDIRDSMANNAFGVAQDLRLRSLEWGFRLSAVKAKVYMRHSKGDETVPFSTAVRTAEILPNCQLELLETGPHFSNEALGDCIEKTIVRNIQI